MLRSYGYIYDQKKRDPLKSSPNRYNPYELTSKIPGEIKESMLDDELMGLSREVADLKDDFETWDHLVVNRTIPQLNALYTNRNKKQHQGKLDESKGIGFLTKQGFNTAEYLRC